MKTCLLNLPYPKRIIRRYNCTYFAPNFLFPPLELMYLGSIIKEWKKDDCILIDAIAERMDLSKIINYLRVYQPDLLVFMAGIELFTDDMQTIMAIKSSLPTLKIACIGYLPSIFPKETLECNPAIDYIIMDEPELSFSELYEYLEEGRSLNALPGITYRNNDKIFVGSKRGRIKDLDTLPFPDRSLIKQELYNEFLLPRLFTTFQASRGCPSGCSFCIRTYGREVIHRSIQNLLAEIEEVIFKYKVKTIHFLDDNFTLNKDKIIELCNLILRKNLKFQWTALSRVGMLNKEMLSLMKQSGLRRLYLGIETSSQRLLDYYRKGYKADLIKEQVRIIKENDIEVGGSFIVGGLQTEKEFRQDVFLAKQTDLDYVVVEKITPYPGTRLFEEMKDSIIFGLFPYVNKFRDIQFQERAVRLEKLFYRDFYFDIHYFIKMLKYLFLRPQDIINGAKKIIQYLFCSQNNQGTRPEVI